MTELLLFLVVVVVVVSVHEMGHYLAARSCGVRVLRFAVGFGKPLLSRFDRRGTEWCLCPIPLGGYVRMVVDPAEAAERGLPARESLEGVSLPKRAWIIFAGPLANFLLALLLLFLVALAGETGLRARVAEVPAGSLAAAAGMAPGDEIVALDGRPVLLWSTVFGELLPAVGVRDVAVRVRGGGGARELTLALAALPPAALDDPELPERLGMVPDLSFVTLELATVVDGSPAQAAGLEAGDYVIAANGEVVYAWRDFVTAIRANAGVEMTVIYERGGGEGVALVTPEAAVGDDGSTFGRLGVIPAIDEERRAALLATERAGPVDAAAQAGRRTWVFIATTGRFFRWLVGGEISAANLAGPVGIARTATAAADRGLTVFLLFMAQISVSLGVLNLLPIPILDGGHLLRYALEGLLRRPLPARIVNLATIAGAALLAALMVFVIYNDLT